MQNQVAFNSGNTSLQLISCAFKVLSLVSFFDISEYFFSFSLKLTFRKNTNVKLNIAIK